MQEANLEHRLASEIDLEQTYLHQEFSHLLEARQQHQISASGYNSMSSERTEELQTLWQLFPRHHLYNGGFLFLLLLPHN